MADYGITSYDVLALSLRVAVATAVVTSPQISLSRLLLKVLALSEPFSVIVASLKASLLLFRVVADFHADFPLQPFVEFLLSVSVDVVDNKQLLKQGVSSTGARGCC